MKKLIVAFAAVLVTAVQSFGQGEVFFSTFNTLAVPPINAPVFLPDGENGPGPSYSAGLFLQSDGSLIASSLTSFQAPLPGGGAIANRYVTPVTVQVPGSPGGSTVTVFFRAWETSAGSYDAAAIRGSSEPFSITLSTAPNTPADITGISGFTMVPEPSTLTLGVLGAAALLLRRRK